MDKCEGCYQPYIEGGEICDQCTNQAPSCNSNVVMWRPIADAPKDGRFAFVYRPLARLSMDEPVALRRLIGGNNHCWDCSVPEGVDAYNPTNGSCHVTHWMPIPEPPTT